MIMASEFHTLHFQTIKTTSHSTQLHLTTAPSVSFRFLKQHNQPSDLSIFPSKPISRRFKNCPLSIHCNASSVSPPTSKEEAILQAKTCLATTLAKPLNNFKMAGKFKKLNQPRFRVEIPVVEDGYQDSLSQLALEIFGDMSVKRKGSAVKILIMWPNPTLKEAGIKSFAIHSKNTVEHMDFLSVNSRNLGAFDIAVLLAPEISQLEVMKAVTDSFYPKPVVLLNPKWGFDEEATFGELRTFVGSFQVVYSFTGLEVRGVISRRKGVIFKCVTNGEEWSVFVEEEQGDLKSITKFRARPSIVEVENVLYNLLAIHSPVTKSVKFFRDIVSNVTGKK